jgi:ubiquinone/menaquinone biosynthesis C-methylase UbiE
MVTFDDELRAHNDRLRAATGVRAGEHVLDVGCGAGQTTREAARTAAPGEVLGIDVTERMVDRARELTAAEGLDNVRYECADAQVHGFAPEHFDLAISRFGLMFFADPDAAFANIARALRPGGRLVALVWQRREDNEWERAIVEALESPAPLEWGDAFSLGDPAATQGILERAGFHDVRLDDVDAPVFYGSDANEALAWVTSFAAVRDALARLDSDARDRARERLRDTLAAHSRASGGVVLPSRSWLVSARRR